LPCLGRAFLYSLILSLLLAAPVRADTPIQVDVTYSGCTIVEGPLSLGLDALPESIDARFVFLAGTWPPPLDTDFDPEVVEASLTLGNASMTADDLQYFTVAFNLPEEGDLTLSTLTWLALVPSGEIDCGDPTVLCGIKIANSFPLDVSSGEGVDAATGLPFHYHCPDSTSSFTELTALTVGIDIKPGSDPNSINLGSSGVVPVAILGSDSFDATTVDPATVSLAGASVKMVGKSDKSLCHEEDVNGDGYTDLVCQVYTAQFMIEEGQSTAVLEATTTDGTPVRGEDDIRIVPDGM